MYRVLETLFISFRCCFLRNENCRMNYNMQSLGCLMDTIMSAMVSNSGAIVLLVSLFVSGIILCLSD